ncbi:MAG: hypothetical protein ACM3PW_07850 [Chlamydiota bacterium]
MLKAKYVFVTTYFGAPFSPTITAEDRQAIVDVKQALRKWGRYSVATTAGEADMTIAVRSGTHVYPKPGITLGKGPDRNTRGYGAVAQIGHDQDLLAVYGPAGFFAAPFWLGARAYGLESPDLPLFQEFKKAVEFTAKHP